MIESARIRTERIPLYEKDEEHGHRVAAWISVMSWKEKLRFLSSGKGIDETFLACNFTTFAPLPESVARFAECRPWLSAAYQDFLIWTNGAQLGTFVLFGVEGEHSKTIHTIESECRLWEDDYPPDQWLPIAKDPSGNPFLMRRNGTIHVGDIEESLPPRPLADDFDALLDSVLMGDGYRLCMRDDDDDWHRFLVDQGWASS